MHVISGFCSNITSSIKDKYLLSELMTEKIMYANKKKFMITAITGALWQTVL